MYQTAVRRFQDLPIRIKLLGGFASVLTLTVILGVLLISQLGTINNAGQKVSGTDMPAVVQIGDISAALNDYESSTLARIIESTAADRADELELGAAGRTAGQQRAASLPAISVSRPGHD